MSSWVAFSSVWSIQYTPWSIRIHQKQRYKTSFCSNGASFAFFQSPFQWFYSSISFQFSSLPCIPNPQVSGHSKSWDISEEEIINAKALSFFESTNGGLEGFKVWKQGEYGVVSLQATEKWWQRKTFSGFLLGPGKLSGANIWQTFQGVYIFKKKLVPFERAKLDLRCQWRHSQSCQPACQRPFIA